MRVNLKVFRIRKKLSQAEISEKIGCNRAAYALIENGNRNGRQEFWGNLQKAFDIPDEEIWALMKDDESR